MVVWDMSSLKCTVWCACVTVCACAAFVWQASEYQHIFLSHLYLSFMQQFPELKFRYVEEDQPDEFFIPYVWSLVFHRSGLHWAREEVKLQHFQEIPLSEDGSNSRTHS